MKHYEYEINLLFDGELTNEEQTGLFNHLASCQICKDNFANYNRLKGEMNSIHKKNIADILIEKGNAADDVANRQTTIGKKKITLYKIGFYASTAAALLLLFLQLSTKQPTTNYSTITKIDTVFVNKKVPVFVTMYITKQMDKKEKVASKLNDKSYIDYIMELPTIKLKPENEGE